MRIRYALAVLLPFASMGCVSSVNGLGGEAVFDPSLVGEWRPVKPRSAGDPWEGMRVERKDDGSAEYKLFAMKVKPDGEEIRHDGVRLVRFGGDEFLELRVNAPGKIPQRYQIFRLRRHDGLMTVDLMDPNYFKKHPDSVAHERTVTQVTITASTDELRVFIREHEGLWSPDSDSATFRRVGPEPTSVNSGNGR